MKEPQYSPRRPSVEDIQSFLKLLRLAVRVGKVGGDILDVIITIKLRAAIIAETSLGNFFKLLIGIFL